MENFIIKAYSKKELALMYFPKSSPQIAVKHLMAWIRRCCPLWKQLETEGYSVRSKTFTPRQVRVITEYLGDP